MLHTPAALLKNELWNYQPVIATRMMPLVDVTKMTDRERAVVAAGGLAQ